MLRCSILFLMIIPLCCITWASESEKGISGFTVTLLHTGSTFSQVLPVDMFNGPCPPGADSACSGGVARRAQYIKNVRATEPHTILLDQGNILQGSLFWESYGPEMINYYYSKMGYNSIALSLRDFQPTRAKLAELLSNTTLHPVCANCNFTLAPYNLGAYIKPYTVINVGGEAIGYTGFLATGSELRMRQGGVDGFIGAEPVFDSLRKTIYSMLVAGVNKIILSVSDQAIVQDIVNQVYGVDILIVSTELITNDNTTYGWSAYYPKVYTTPWNTKVLVVGQGQYGTRIGHLRVTFDNLGYAMDWSGDSVALTSGFSSDPEIEEDVNIRYAGIVASYALPVATTLVDMPFTLDTTCLFAECLQGNIVADATRFYGKTQIGIVNGGAVRGGFSKGNITLGQFLQAFPFGGTSSTLKLKGIHVLQMLENGVSKYQNMGGSLDDDIGRFLSVSGLRYQFNPTQPVGKRIIRAWVEVTSGRWDLLTLKDNTETLYSLTCSDYLRNGGDGFSVIATNAIEPYDYGPTIDSFYLDYIKLISPIDRTTEGRITQTNEIQEQPITETDSGSDDTALIVGLTVGLGVPAIIIILALIAGLVAYIVLKTKFHVIVLSKRRDA